MATFNSTQNNLFDEVTVLFYKRQARQACSALKKYVHASGNTLVNPRRSAKKPTELPRRSLHRPLPIFVRKHLNPNWRFTKIQNDLIANVSEYVRVARPFDFNPPMWKTQQELLVEKITGISIEKLCARAPARARQQMNRDEEDVPATSLFSRIGSALTDNPMTRMVQQTEKLVTEVAGCTGEFHKSSAHLTGVAAAVERSAKGVSETVQLGIDSIKAMLEAMVPTVSLVKDLGSILLRMVKILATVSMSNAQHRLKVFFMEVAWNFGAEIASVFSALVSKYFKQHTQPRTTRPQPDRPRTECPVTEPQGEVIVEHEVVHGEPEVIEEAQFQIDISGLVEAMSDGTFQLASSQAAAPLTGALLSTLLVTAFGLPTGNFDQCLSFFGNRCRNLNNVVSFSKNAVPLFTAISDWILECFRGPLADQNLDSTLNGYAKFVREVIEIQEVSKSGETLKDRLEKDEKLVFKIDNLYRQGVEFSKELTAKRFGPQLTTQLNQCMKIVEKMKRLSDNTGVFGNKPRMEPIVIHLFGESGVGKSGMSWPLASDMNAALTSDNQNAADFAKDIYFRNTEQEFWDGYHGQNVVCYDDFGQRVDGVSNPNEEFMEIIRVGNIAPYPLHMASIEEKQRTKFCSKVVLLTSNKLEQNVNSLTFSDAYRRRINVCGKVENVDGVTYSAFSKTTGMVVPRLDVTKTNGPVDTSVYKITLYDAETQQPLMETAGDVESGLVQVPRVLDYDQFLDLCLKKMKALWYRSRALNKELEDRLTNDRVTMLRAKLQIETGINLESGEPTPVDGELLSVNVQADPRPTPYSMDPYDNLDTYLDQCLIDLTEVENEIFPPSKLDRVKNGILAVVDTAKGYFRSIVDSICSIKGVLILLGASLVGFGLWSLFVAEKPAKGAREIYEGPPQRRAPASERKEKKSFIVGVSEPAEIEAASSGDFHTPRQPTVVREAASSGDFHTPRKPTVVREAFVSGDARTVRAKLVQREATSSGDFNTPRPRTVVRETVAPDAEMQAWKDKTAQELISHRIITNTFKFSKQRTDGTWIPLLNGLFIRDTVMLAPYHLIPELAKSDVIRIENLNGARFELPFSACSYHQLTTKPDIYGKYTLKDACLIKFPRHVGAYSDIVKHFQLNHDLRHTRADINLYTVRHDGKRTLGMILGNRTAHAIDTKSFNVAGEIVELRQGYEYDLPTNNGDCGAPLILQEPTCLRKIAGIHVLALVDGKRAFAQSVTRGDLERALEKFGPLIKTDFDDMANFQFTSVELPLDTTFDTADLVKLLHLPAPTFSYVGECDTNVFVPGKTDIQPSVIYGQVSDPITRPALLWSPTTNLLHKNLEKCAMETPFIPQEAIDRAVASYKPLLFNGTKDYLQRILTFEEAVRGLSEESEYLSSINRSSSPGFPWVLYRPGGTKGKTAWLGDEEYVFDDVVRFSVQSRIDNARQGIRTACIWTDTLKDERRPHQKVLDEKTRVFGNGPMDYTIAFRQYFLGFLAHIMENRINNEQSLGTNVYSGDWKATRDYLQRKGKKVIAGDFSTFDGTLNSCIMWEFVNVINDWYDDGEENALIRQTLFLEVINSMHLCDGMFYMMNHSQPSGNPITTALNSFYNSISMRIVYDICRKRAGQSVNLDFNSQVNMVSYGDDNVVNFTDLVSTWFNQNTITEAYREIGMIYTDELKSGDEMADHRLIGEVAYLKRHFREDDERVYAPLDLSVVLETCNWVRNGPDAVGDCKANCETAISELAQHPRDVFTKYSSMIEKAFRASTEETLSFKTYDEYEEYAIEQYYT